MKRPDDDHCQFGMRSTSLQDARTFSGRMVIMVLFLSVLVPAAYAQTVMWEDSFVQGQPPTTEQCQRWTNFLNALGQKTFASVTISGTYDEVGKTITDPAAATQLAHFLSAKTPGTVNSGGNLWAVGNLCGLAACKNEFGSSFLGITLSVAGSANACNCNDTYAIKPHSSGSQWGGINTSTCSGPSQTMRLVFHSGVTVVAGGPTEFCPGGSVVLTANTASCEGPYSYLWSNGATTQSITVTQPGDYSVTVSGINGCSGTSSPTTVSLSEVSVDAGEAEPFCAEPVQLNATGVSGTGSSGTVNAFCLFDAPGGAGGCSFAAGDDICQSSLNYITGSFSKMVTLSNPTEVRFKIYYTAYEPVNFIFKLNDLPVGSLQETAPTGACVTYEAALKTFAFEPASWLEGVENKLTVEFNTSGQGIPGRQGLLLAGISAEVITVNETYTWSPATGLTDAAVRNPLASPEVTTTYTVTYTGANGCTATDEVVVEVDCNTAPVAVCKPVVVSADANCQAAVDAADFNGGSTSNSGGQLTFSVYPAGPYAVGETTVTLTVSDEHGESSTCTTTVTVNDTTVPVITVADIVANNDPGTCTATFTLSPPEASDNCGIQSVTNDLAAEVFPVGATFVTWTVTDIHGNQATALQKVTVSNSEPVISSVTASPSMVEANNPVSLTVEYADNNIRAASIDWGDFSEETVVEYPASVFSVTHTYTAEGTYPVTVTLADECEAAVSFVYEYITVIEKRSGSVKGNGWFYSKPGYYLKNRRADGKAHFDFDARYSNQGAVLTGKASFRFKEGRLNFRSTDYEFLRVDEQHAFLTGSGKLNGQRGYRILISMVDDDRKHRDGDDDDDRYGDNGRKGYHHKKGDRIRVTIWDPNGSVVYDTQSGEAEDAVATTNIGGGDIKVNSGGSFEERMDDFIDSYFGEESVSVYPNPFIDWIEVHFAATSEEKISLQLMDLTGKVIFAAQRAVSEDGTYSFEIGNDKREKGIYLLKVSQGRRVEVTRLVRN